MGNIKNLQEQNKFHPSCILSVMTQQMLPPHGATGLTELLTFLLGEGRNSKLSGKGVIHGFKFNVMPRIVVALPYLQMQFPEMAEYARTLSPSKIKLLHFSKRLSSMWILEIEKKFGKSVQVKQIDSQDLHQAQQAVVTNQLAYLDINKPLFATWWTTQKAKVLPHPNQKVISNQSEKTCTRAKL